MKDTQYLFCMKQFKPAIILIAILAAVVVGWTAYSEGFERSGFRGMRGKEGAMRTATAPPIRFGVKAPHPDWGACDNCHDVFRGKGGAPGATPAAATMQVATAPPIKAGTKAPHPDWGSCTTCHDVINPGATPAAATMQVASVAPPLGGVWLRPITVATADRLGLDNADGVLVSGVKNNSTAAAAGLQVGDVIQRIDNTKVENLTEALTIVATKAPGETVKLQVMRSGRAKKIFVPIPEGTRMPSPPPVVHVALNGAAPSGRVAVAATSADVGAQVAPSFGRAPAFVIYDPAGGRYTAIPNQGAGTLTGGQQAVSLLQGAGVGALIVGNIGPSSLGRLRQSGIQVYSGGFGTVQSVVGQYQRGTLVAANGSVVPRGTPNGIGGPAPQQGKIAVAISGAGVDAAVAQDLGLAPYLLIYDLGTGQTEVVAKDAAPDQGASSVQTTHLLVDRGATAVIAGNISPESVRSLSQLGVFSFAGVQGSAGQAIDLYRSGALQATTVPAGGGGGQGPRAAGQGVTV